MESYVVEIGDEYVDISVPYGVHAHEFEDVEQIDLQYQDLEQLDLQYLEQESEEFEIDSDNSCEL